MSRSRNEWTLPYRFLTRTGKCYYWQRKSGLTANRSWEWKFDVQTIANIIIDFLISGVISRLLSYCEAEFSTFVLVIYSMLVLLCCYWIVLRRQIYKYFVVPLLQKQQVTDTYGTYLPFDPTIQRRCFYQLVVYLFVLNSIHWSRTFSTKSLLLCTQWLSSSTCFLHFCDGCRFLFPFLYFKCFIDTEHIIRATECSFVQNLNLIIEISFSKHNQYFYKTNKKSILMILFRQIKSTLQYYCFKLKPPTTIR